MSSPAYLNLLQPRDGPVQQASIGSNTCTQQICGSSYSCADTGLEFQCMTSSIKPAYDIEFLGLTMRCDADGTGYPYIVCTCIYDPVNCLDAGGAKFGSGSPSAVGQTGYAESTTVIGGSKAGATATGKAGSSSKTGSGDAQTTGSGSSDLSGSAASKSNGGLGWAAKGGLLLLVGVTLVL